MHKKKQELGIQGSRWEELYKLDQKQKDQIEQKAKIQEEERKIKESREYSFKPKLLTSSKEDKSFIQDQSTMSHLSKLSVVDRN
jgi:hypothetical protein